MSHIIIFHSKHILFFPSNKSSRYGKYKIFQSDHVTAEEVCLYYNCVGMTYGYLTSSSLPQIIEILVLKIKSV